MVLGEWYPRKFGKCHGEVPGPKPFWEPSVRISTEWRVCLEVMGEAAIKGVCKGQHKRRPPRGCAHKSCCWGRREDGSGKERGRGQCQHDGSGRWWCGWRWWWWRRCRWHKPCQATDSELYHASHGPPASSSQDDDSHGEGPEGRCRRNDGDGWRWRRWSRRWAVVVEEEVAATVAVRLIRTQNARVQPQSSTRSRGIDGYRRRNRPANLTQPRSATNCSPNSFGGNKPSPGVAQATGSPQG